ncbi:MAG: phosphoribosyl-AMP cyclohydrolase, partial [Tropicimonas sp.]
RQSYWVKGETSGHTQRLIEMRIDCDRDCLLVLIEQTGPACHTNRRSCFYTAIREGAEVVIAEPME